MQREAANPVDTVLSRALPKVRKVVRHHKALPWQDVPAFYDELTRRDAVAAKCLRLLILTASRSGEVRGARWSEIDIDKRTWTLPLERMKARRAHSVPLSETAVVLIEEMRGLDPEFVFPAQSRGKPLSENVFRALFNRMDREGLTAHGFRSSFRNWCGDRGHVRQLAEIALAHPVAGVEGVYMRSDLFQRRRLLMAQWAAFVTGAQGDVVELVRA